MKRGTHFPLEIPKLFIFWRKIPNRANTQKKAVHNFLVRYNFMLTTLFLKELSYRDKTWNQVFQILSEVFIRLFKLEKMLISKGNSVAEFGLLC